MSTINTGGPAFPSAGIESATDCRRENRDGMELLDYFAAQAMQGWCADNDNADCFDEPKDMAKAAYEIAQAMLAERERIMRGGE